MSTVELDAIDRKILSVLQHEGRLTNEELSKRVGLSSSPCLRRLKRLETEGVISRYAAVLDQVKVGLPISVFTQVKVERHGDDVLQKLEEAFRRWPEVMECYLMTGPRDYLLRVVVADLPSYERFLKEKLTRLSGVASIESSFALQQVKYGVGLPL